MGEKTNYCFHPPKTLPNLSKYFPNESKKCKKLIKAIPQILSKKKVSLLFFLLLVTISASASFVFLFFYTIEDTLSLLSLY